jgi:DNA-binding MarR family transcriptional regulator
MGTTGTTLLLEEIRALTERLAGLEEAERRRDPAAVWRLDILEALARRGPCRLEDLPRTWPLNRPQLERLVAELEGKGMVQRAAHGWYSLTGSGAARLRQRWPRRAELILRLAPAGKADRLTRAAEAVRVLRESLTEETGDGLPTVDLPRAS